jgi:hypothetical protein
LVVYAAVLQWVARLVFAPISKAEGDAMSDNAALTVADGTERAVDETGGGLVPSLNPLRAYDAWALPVEVLLHELKAESIVTGLFADAEGVLIAREGRVRLYTDPELDDAAKEQVLRQLLAEYLGSPRRRGTQPSSTGAQKVACAGVLADVTALYRGNAWEPEHGWCSDEEAIARLRSLVTDTFGGLAEDVPGGTPVPEGVGAAIVFGQDEEGDEHPLVFVRTDIPSGLRADLWGFCLALAAWPGTVKAEADKDGICYIGMDGAPVTGRGTALLASLMIQRVGRRPGDCGFPLIKPLSAGAHGGAKEEAARQTETAPGSVAA